MSRRQPELALAVGLVLGLPAAVFVGLFADVLLAGLVGLVVAVPFAAYAVAIDDDPTTVLVPDYVLAGAAGLGALAGLGGLLTGRPALGALVGIAMGVPGVVYHVRYGEPVNPLGPFVTAALAVVVAAVVVGVGLATGDPAAGALGALLATLTGGDYLRERGGRLPQRTERFVVGGCLGAAVVAVAGSVVLSQALLGAVVGAGFLGAGALVGYRP